MLHTPAGMTRISLKSAAKVGTASSALKTSSSSLAAKTLASKPINVNVKSMAITVPKTPTVQSVRLPKKSDAGVPKQPDVPPKSGYARDAATLVIGAGVSTAFGYGVSEIANAVARKKNSRDKATTADTATSGDPSATTDADLATSAGPGGPDGTRPDASTSYPPGDDEGAEDTPEYSDLVTGQDYSNATVEGVGIPAGEDVSDTRATIGKEKTTPSPRKLTTGGIVGIALGGTAALVLLTVGGVWVYRYYRKRPM